MLRREVEVEKLEVYIRIWPQLTFSNGAIQCTKNSIENINVVL